MFYHLFPPLAEVWFGFNVFRYITFRTAYATITALVITLLAGPWVIRRLRALKVAHAAEREELGFHARKLGTPTMGGTLIVGAVVLSTLLWGNFSNPAVPLILAVFVGLAAIGFLDDYLKLTKRNPQGLSARWKLAGQGAIALAVASYLYARPLTGPAPFDLSLPFLKGVVLPLGALYIPFAAIVIVGASNAVNLTDGLDGLAAGCVAACAVAYAALAYVVGHEKIAAYLRVAHVVEAGEVTVFLGALAGACLGFLWYNAYPAEVFMGDVGSLALGGAIGTAAILVRQEVLLVAVGGVFVAEALSVILQVASFRLTGKRIFRMAPLHHHFELAGWPEPKVTVRFWIAAALFTLLTVSTLKLR